MEFAKSIILEYLEYHVSIVFPQNAATNGTTPLFHNNGDAPKIKFLKKFSN